MDDPKFNCQRANQIDLVGYLQSLGHQPKKVRGADYWYLSPLREEKTPSFKVNKTRNIWYDHGIGKGGNLVDFGILYHRCTIAELLNQLFQNEIRPFSFHQPLSPGLIGAGEKEGVLEGKITILQTRPLAAQTLIDYLLSRKIPLDIAARTCQEVDFLLYGKQHTAIGFGNRSGGYELRNEHFKGSSSPKDITFFDNRTVEIAVLEGFFNFLSFQTINQHKDAPLTNYLVLNSLAFLEKSRPLMEQYSRIHLLLDRDAAGIDFTRKALQWNPDKYVDRSEYYRGHKDLNEWLVRQPPPYPRQTRRLGRSL